MLQRAAVDRGDRKRAFLVTTLWAVVRKLSDSRRYLVEMRGIEPLTS
jgi:hypothetical protein